MPASEPRSRRRAPPSPLRRISACALATSGSSNGTYVRIPPHAERELRDGDFVRMGHEVLRVAVAE